MRIRTLKLHGVRNLVPLQFEPGPRFNVFAGDNGQGKTNLLESIYLVCALRSFRTSTLGDVIVKGGEGAHIQATVDSDRLERTYELTLTPVRRTARLDGKAVRPLVKYFGGFNVVLFAPEDLQIPRGSPGPRRRFLDRAVFGQMPGFMALVQDFEKSLRSRNALLKKMQTGRPDELLAVYTEQVAQTGARVIAARRAYVRDIEAAVAAAFGRIMRGPLTASVHYECRFAATDETTLAGELAAALDEALPKDRARGFTTVGPHRDDLVFTLDGHPAGTFASQGQMRALILAWKTAELSVLEERVGHPPILLLDDVSSELDANRNQYLFEFLRDRPNQCFITTTHPRHVLLEEPRRDYLVQAGAVCSQS